MDAWPDDEPPLSPYTSVGWARMRLYCPADDPDPGIGDHGERHLIQFWPVPEAAPPIHPEITEEDRQARAAYAVDMAMSVEDYS